MHKMPTELQPLFWAARTKLFQLLPGLEETWKFMGPWYHYRGYLGYLNWDRKERRLYLGFFHGKHLPHHPLLDGKNLKQVKLTWIPSQEVLDAEAFAEVVILAARYNEQIASKTKRAIRARERGTR